MSFCVNTIVKFRKFGMCSTIHICFITWPQRSFEKKMSMTYLTTPYSIFLIVSLLRWISLLLIIAIVRTTLSFSSTYYRLTSSCFQASQLSHAAWIQRHWNIPLETLLLLRKNTAIASYSINSYGIVRQWLKIIAIYDASNLSELLFVAPYIS